MRDNLISDLKQGNNKNRIKYNLEVTPSPEEQHGVFHYNTNLKVDNNYIKNSGFVKFNTSNKNLNEYNKDTNLLMNTNHLGYINEESSNIYNSTKLRFENQEENDNQIHISQLQYHKQKTENLNVRLDMDIVSTYIRSKTHKARNYKINTSSDSC